MADDINFAGGAQLISNKDVKLLHDWVKNDEKLRKVQLKLASGDRLNIRDLVFMLGREVLGFHRKNSNEDQWFIGLMKTAYSPPLIGGLEK